MIPENAANWREFGTREALKHSRVIPELELDNVGLASHRRNIFQSASYDDVRPGRFNLGYETTVSGSLKQNKSLLYDIGQSRTHSRVRLADPAAKMRRDMQDL